MHISITGVRKDAWLTLAVSIGETEHLFDLPPLDLARGKSSHKRRPPQTQKKYWPHSWHALLLVEISPRTILADAPANIFLFHVFIRPASQNFMFALNFAEVATASRLERRQGCRSGVWRRAPCLSPKSSRLLASLSASPREPPWTLQKWRRHTIPYG